MKIKVENIALRSKVLNTIAQANIIIAEYAAQGYGLTLRQLYYQFVSRGFLPNTQREYMKLGTAISSGRRAGLIDWDAIVDRTRFVRSPSTWVDPADIINTCASQFKLDRWADQPTNVEVWFEKDALLGIFERAALDWRLPLLSCRGYGSDSTYWEAAQRMIARTKRGRHNLVLHFGDHDPSGIDMTRDIEARFALFGAIVEVRRLALTIKQVRKYNPPPNPAKETDSRFAGYRDLYGDESWELDALSPDVLVKLVSDEVKKVLDEDKWAESGSVEQAGRDELRVVANHFPAAVKAAAKVEAREARKIARRSKRA